MFWFNWQTPPYLVQIIRQFGYKVDLKILLNNEQQLQGALKLVTPLLYLLKLWEPNWLCYHCALVHSHYLIIFDFQKGIQFIFKRNRLTGLDLTWSSPPEMNVKCFE